MMLTVVGGVDERSGARLGSSGRGTGVFVRMFTCKRAVEQGDTTPVCPQEIGIIETDSTVTSTDYEMNPLERGGGYGRCGEC